MSTYIRTVRHGAGGPRVAVKDCIDVAGLPTTMGCAALLPHLAPATADAACLAGMRRLGARITGKTNMSELGHSGSGVNEYFGTPVNPIDPRLVPGGSSSGSAVAVAEGSADIALGTDTTGSVRIPAAACGVCGMVLTRGRVPTGGVHPLAPSLDTVGVLARDVAGLGLGLRLLLGTEGRPSEGPELVRTLDLGGRAPPELGPAIERALHAAGLRTRVARIPSWHEVAGLAQRLMAAEAYRTQRPRFAGEERLSAEVRTTFTAGRAISDAEVDRLRAALASWRRALVRRLAPGTLLALPAILDRPPPLAAARPVPHANGPVNAAGLPAVCLPIRAGHPFASLQLVGPPDGEPLLLAAAGAVEAANRAG